MQKYVVSYMVVFLAINSCILHSVCQIYIYLQLGFIKIGGKKKKKKKTTAGQE